ncbi:hypothetical protein ACM42_16725 [Bradyrhizobium sp. CCBAU 25338]|nr:hypothetical protein [Bradyrhizobium sp. CCBAU 25338]
MVGQFAGTALPVQPTAHDLVVAWAQLGHPLGDFVKALIGLGRKVPEILEHQDEGAEYEKLRKRAKASPRVFIEAIWREIPLCASRETADLLNRYVKRLFPRGIPEPDKSDSAASARECHVVDSFDRPLICRAIEHGKGGRVEILDLGSGYLHQDTLKLSAWRLIDGWLTRGQRVMKRGNPDESGAPSEDLQLNLPRPKI